ncbi:hypothetical protein [Sphingomonas cavernae]|uniref:hypothetical protein n=1 Tax=Sphingomonas cavernae TaxID=2320861 RepID=UPI0011C39DC0|nr:hypothetical protein [Sphingomonas cavernae]
MNINGFGVRALLLAACMGTVAPTTAMAASDYVRCDGQSKGMGVAEGLARLTLVIGTMGLLGAPESDNVAERRFGTEGVAACTAALSEGKGKRDDRRRSRLMLARAIHHVEAKELESALSDVRSFPAIGGERAADGEFLRSLALSAIELEAAILVRVNRPAEAEAAALRMAAQSPYDIQNLLRAQQYLRPDGAMDGARRGFYANFVRLAPQARLELAEAQEWAGDFAGAAATLAGLVALVEGDTVAANILAQIAIQHILGGNIPVGEAQIALARRANDDRAAAISGADSQREKDAVARTDELLEFARIATLARQGRIDDARLIFSARARWLAPSVPAVAHLTALLREGAAPTQLQGALARDPQQLRADAIKAHYEALTNEAATKRLYATIRPILTDGDYSRLSAGVRQTTDSKYLQIKRDDKRGEVLIVQGGNGIAGGEALLLHAAYLAKKRGSTGFVILPMRVSTTSARIVFEKPGESALPADAYFDSAELIAALDARFPMPAK